MDQHPLPSVDPVEGGPDEQQHARTDPAKELVGPMDGLGRLIHGFTFLFDLLRHAF
jgi:hypothetical protein